MFGRKQIRKPLAAFAVMMMGGQVMADPKTITFSELQDPAALIYEDPFRDMGLDMLEELRTVVRLETRVEQGDIPDDAQERLMTSLADARTRLEDNGHDIEALLAQRWIVAENRKRATTSTNADLENADVTIDGFLIPAGSDDAGAPIAYLVPEVGMCSHMPPPPPNQLILVQLAEPSPISTPYVMVQISGSLRQQASDESIFVLDGEARMHSMWKLNAETVVAAPGTTDTVARNEWQELFRSKNRDRSPTGTD